METIDNLDSKTKKELYLHLQKATVTIKVEDLPELLTSWITELKKGSMSINTINNYEYHNKKFISWLKSEDNDVEIIDNPNILDQYKKYLKEADYKAKTVNTYLTSANVFLNHLGINTDELKIIDKVSNEPIYIKPNEMENVFKSIPENNIRDAALLHTLYDTAGRVSEVTALNMEDIDFNTYPGHIAVHILHGKGDKERTVLISKETYKSITAMVEARKPEHKNNNAIFINREGNRLSTRSVAKIVKKYAEKTDKLQHTGNYYTSHLTPHKIRHSRARALLDDGVNVNDVKDYLGHSSIKITDIYLQSTTKDMLNAVDKKK